MTALRCAALIAVAPLALVAQQRPPVVAAGRTIVGSVVDSSDRIIDSAEVFIPALKRSTSADSLGRFRFNDVKPGEYQVAARRLGFYPQTRTVIVTKDSGGVAMFALVPYSRGLAPVVTSARRGGLSGVVGDTAWNAIKGAEISVISTSKHAVSDSMGGFFMELLPGKHMIRVVRDGYASQMVSVTVPKDSGRRMMVFLKPSGRAASAVEEAALFETDMRLARRSAAYSQLFTREDLNKAPWKELSEAAQAGAGRFVPPSCRAFIDGGPKTEFIWALRTSEIEAIEVYRTRATRSTVTSINGGGRQIRGNANIGRITQVPGGEEECPDTVYVWLRK